MKGFLREIELDRQKEINGAIIQKKPGGRIVDCAQPTRVRAVV